MAVSIAQTAKSTAFSLQKVASLSTRLRPLVKPDSKELVMKGLSQISAQLSSLNPLSPLSQIKIERSPKKQKEVFDYIVESKAINIVTHLFTSLINLSFIKDRLSDQELFKDSDGSWDKAWKASVLAIKQLKDMGSRFFGYLTGANPELIKSICAVAPKAVARICKRGLIQADTQAKNYHELCANTAELLLAKLGLAKIL